jgi:hypothetical protein
MSSRFGVSAKARHQHSFGATLSLTAADRGVAPASDTGGPVSQEHPDDEVSVAELFPPPGAKEYLYASFGPFKEGHYTEY